MLATALISVHTALVLLETFRDKMRFSLTADFFMNHPSFIVLHMMMTMMI